MLEYKESLGGTKIFIDGNWVGWKLRGINKKEYFQFFDKKRKVVLEIEALVTQLVE